MNQRLFLTANRAGTVLLATASLFLGAGCGESGTTDSRPSPGFPAPESGPTTAVASAHPTAVPPGLSDSDLGQDATETFLRWSKAGEPTPPGGSPGDIGSDFWLPRVVELRPLRLYTHRVNLVLVTNQTGALQEGYYVVNALSSYLPHPGEPDHDGFQFAFPGSAASSSGSAPATSGPLRFRRQVPAAAPPETPTR